MAGSRTLKLSILADVDDLKKKLGTGADEVQSFGSKLGDFGKKAGIAFGLATAAAAAYATKLAIDGVKAAAEDEAAQLKLATSLKNVTGATDTQIASVEKYILKTSLATGINDEQLRPSLDRLARSTKNVEEAQKLQTLALDIAAGTGKDLETVSNALAKAYDGNFGALGKLGGGIDAATLKTKDFDLITKQLSDTFKDQASLQADTFEGKMARLKVAFGEAKESVGGFILDALTPVLNSIVQYVVPAVQSFVEALGGKKGLSSAFADLVSAAKSFIIPVIKGIQAAFETIRQSVSDNQEELKAIVDFAKKFLLPFFGGALKLGIEAVARAFGLILDTVGKIVRTLQTMISIGKTIGGSISGLFGGGKAAGGPVRAGTTYLVGEKGPELFTPNSNGNIIPNGAMGGGSINITVNGAVDAASTARQIAEILNSEASSSGSFSGLGVSRFATRVG